MRRGLVIAVLALALLPSAARADTSAVFEDCQDGRLDTTHSAKDLRNALSDIPVDLDEYTNCREIIRSAQHGVRGPGGSGPTTDATTGKKGYGPVIMGEGGLPVGAEKRPFNPRDLAQPDEIKEIDEIAAPRREDPIRIQQVAQADEVGTAPARSSGAELPTTLIVVLVLAACAFVVPAAVRLRSLVLRRGA